MQINVENVACSIAMRLMDCPSHGPGFKCASPCTKKGFQFKKELCYFSTNNANFQTGRAIGMREICSQMTHTLHYLVSQLDIGACTRRLPGKCARHGERASDDERASRTPRMSKRHLTND